MSRKWMVAAGVAAIIALVIGAAVGRSIIPSSPQRAAPPEPAQFTDAEARIALTYPGTWRRLQSDDPQVRLLAAAGPETSLSLRVTKSELAAIKPETLPIVRQLTDPLIAADDRARQLSAPEAVSLPGLLGYRYRYRYTGQDGGTGAHVHYFLFKRGKMIQLVFQAVPATALPTVEPTFERIAATLRSTEG